MFNWLNWTFMNSPFPHFSPALQVLALHFCFSECHPSGAAQRCKAGAWSCWTGRHGPGVCAPRAAKSARFGAGGCCGTWPCTAICIWWVEGGPHLNSIIIQSVDVFLVNKNCLVFNGLCLMPVAFWLFVFLQGLLEELCAVIIRTDITDKSLRLCHWVWNRLQQLLCMRQVWSRSTESNWHELQQSTDSIPLNVHESSEYPGPNSDSHSCSALSLRRLALALQLRCASWQPLSGFGRRARGPDRDAVLGAGLVEWSPCGAGSSAAAGDAAGTGPAAAGWPGGGAGSSEVGWQGSATRRPAAEDGSSGAEQRSSQMVGLWLVRFGATDVRQVRDAGSCWAWLARLGICQWWFEGGPGSAVCCRAQEPFGLALGLRCQRCEGCDAPNRAAQGRCIAVCLGAFEGRHGCGIGCCAAG